jgi:putative aldouronate transport system substrate-binding protein
VKTAQLVPIYTTMKGPTGKDLVVNNPIRGYGKFFITKAATAHKNIDAILRWVDVIYSDYGQIVEKYGAEGQQWTRKADGTLDITGYKQTFARFPGIEGHAYLGTLSASPPKIEVTTVQEYLDSTESYIPFGWDPVKEAAFDKYVWTKSLPAVSVGIPLDAETVVLDQHKELFSYMNQSVMKFITGASSFNDWDKYVATAKTLGLDDVTKVYQAMYDRYIKK